MRMEGAACRTVVCMKKILVSSVDMCVCGVIGYMDKKLLDSCCGLRYREYVMRLNYLRA